MFRISAKLVHYYAHMYVLLIAEMCLHFKVKALMANGDLPNMQDVPAIKISPDASKSHNASLPEKQQKSQVSIYVAYDYVGG